MVAWCGRNAGVTVQEDADEGRLTAHEDRQAPWVGHADCQDVVSVTLKTRWVGARSSAQ